MADLSSFFENFGIVVSQRFSRLRNMEVSYDYAQAQPH